MVHLFFAIGLLTGGVILLIVVILLCVFVKRLKKQVTNLPSPVYTEAFQIEDIKGNPSKKRKKNVYQSSPMPQRPPSTLRRSYSNESITFVPSTNDGAQSYETSNEKPSASNIECVELKTFQPDPTPLKTESSLNVGCANQAFVPDTSNVPKLPEKVHAYNAKRPKMNTPLHKRPASAVNSVSREEKMRGERSNSSNSEDLRVHRLSFSNLSKSFKDYLHNRNSPKKCQPSKSNDDCCAKNVEQPLPLKQETKIMAEFDKLEQDCSESKNVQDNDKETCEPVYVNVGTYASKINPEIHMLTNENETEKFQKSTLTQEMNCNEQPSESRDAQNGYQDYSGQTGNQNFSEQNGYQDHIEQNEYQDLNGQHVYQGFSGQDGYQELGGQSEYVDFSGQYGYQESSGQDGYQECSGQDGYQEFGGQNVYVDFSGQYGYQESIGQGGDQDYSGQNWYYNNEIEGNNNESPKESNYYGNISDAVELSEVNEENAGHFNEGFQDHVDTEPVYETPLEGEEDNNCVNR